MILKVSGDAELPLSPQHVCVSGQRSQRSGCIGHTPLLRNLRLRHTHLLAATHIYISLHISEPLKASTATPLKVVATLRCFRQNKPILVPGLSYKQAVELTQLPRIACKHNYVCRAGLSACEILSCTHTPRKGLLMATKMLKYINKSYIRQVMPDGVLWAEKIEI